MTSEQLDELEQKARQWPVNFSTIPVDRSHLFDLIALTRAGLVAVEEFQSATSLGLPVEHTVDCTPRKNRLIREYLAGKGGAK